MLLISSAFAATLQVPGEFSTIQGALDAAEDGDVVQVAEGNYSEDLTFAVPVTVEADGAVRIVGKHLVAADTALVGVSMTGNGSDVCLRVDAADLSMSGGELSGCNGAIRAEDANVVLTEVELQGNTATSEPGAVDVHGTLTLTDCVVAGNSTTYGSVGAIQVEGDTTVSGTDFTGNQGYNGAGALAVQGQLLLTDSTFSGDRTTYGVGGAIAGRDGQVVVDGCVFDGTRAYNGGGAISVVDGDLSVIDSAFHDVATTYGTGGAIAWSEGDFLVLSNVDITGAAAQSGGGALFGRGSSAELTDVRVVDASTLYGPGGGVQLSVTSAELVRVWIVNGYAQESGGGAQVAGADVSVRNSVFQGNEAGTGGGLTVSGDRAEIVNNDFLGNVALYSADQLTLSSSSTSFLNNAVAGAASTTTLVASGTVDHGHNAWWDNVDEPWAPADTDVLEDCQFVAAPDDLHLADGSPCIDAGLPEILDVDGSVSDIGAYGGPDGEAPVDDDTDAPGTLDSGGFGDGGPGSDSVEPEGDGVRGFCGCRGGNALILFGFLMLGRRFTSGSTRRRLEDTGRR